MLKHESGAVFPYFLIFCFILFSGVYGANLYGSHQVRRLKEAQLLFVGDQFCQAIKSYYLERKVYPDTLDELISDSRFINKHHLRKLYKDPITGEADWTLLFSNKQKIIGVASKSNAQPIKRSGFSELYKNFNNASHYSDWKFIYKPD